MSRHAKLVSAVSALALCIGVCGLGAQPAPKAPEPGSLASIPTALLGDALVVTVLAVVPQADSDTPWEARDLKYTIPGSAVSVKLVGSDVAVMLTLTPHRSADGKLLLVAQSQVWFKEGESLSYRTSINTVTVSYGEKLLFYPLGVADGGLAPVRIELSVSRYDPANPPQLPAASQEKTGP